MKKKTLLLAGILSLCLLIAVPASFAAGEIVLVDGRHAVIEGKQLILIDKDSRRSVAPPGRYDTRDGRYSIVVKGKDVVIVDHTTMPR
jgi:hypothetical protein